MKAKAAKVKVVQSGKDKGKGKQPQKEKGKQKKCSTQVVEDEDKEEVKAEEMVEAELGKSTYDYIQCVYLISISFTRQTISAEIGTCPAIRSSTPSLRSCTTRNTMHTYSNVLRINPARSFVSLLVIN